MKRTCLILGFVLLYAALAWAHDPYEISSVVYVRSNQIELFIELEFPTGMTLAGQKPSREVTALSQFEAALPQLEQLAGGFFEITAGNHAALPLRTNVQLGMEDHIQFRLEFAPTDYRPLRFVPRGLRGVEDSSYGVSLTVLDMEKQKVLGQTTLFADSTAVDFPLNNSTVSPAPLATPTLAVNKPAPRSLDAPAPDRTTTGAETVEPRRAKPLVSLLVFVILGITLVIWRYSTART